MRPAVEGTLVTASAEDPAIDWEASGIKAEVDEKGKTRDPSVVWSGSDPNDEPVMKLKAKPGQHITEFRYRLLTDMEYTETLKYLTGEGFAMIPAIGINVYNTCIVDVKRNGKALDQDVGIKRAHKYSVGYRIWRASQLSEKDRDF